ncbi:hypothetical protein D3C72_1601950 [compost metagenome]
MRRVHNEHSRLGVVDRVQHFLGRQAGIQGHLDQAGLVQRAFQFNDLGAVPGLDGNAVALLQPQSQQRVGQAVRARFQLSEANGAIAENNGGTVAPVAGVAGGVAALVHDVSVWEFACRYPARWPTLFG